MQRFDSIMHVSFPNPLKHSRQCSFRIPYAKKSGEQEPLGGTSVWRAIFIFSPAKYDITGVGASSDNLAVSLGSLCTTECIVRYIDVSGARSRRAGASQRMPRQARHGLGLQRVRGLKGLKGLIGFVHRLC